MSGMTCIVCPVGCRLDAVQLEDGSVAVTGNACPRGAAYGKQEFIAPMRTVTTSVRVEDGVRTVVSVKTNKPVAKKKIPEILAIVKETRVHAPCEAGEIAIENPAGCGADVIFTTTMPRRHAVQA